MSTPLCQAVMPKAPPKPSSLIVATPVNDSSAAIKFWASQSVGTFSGKGFRVWLYSFEDYCNAFNLPDSARLREVGSKQCNNSHIWHHNMLFETWEELKTKARKHFIGYEPDPHHILNQVKINQFTSLQPFIVKFQDLVGIPIFENALTPSYAGLIFLENYAIYVERELNKDVKATSKCNPLSSSSKKKETSIAKTIEAKFKDIQSRFEAIYLAHEHPSCGPRPIQGPYVFTGNCYNCGNHGHKSERCTKPCSIFKSTDHTNFSCNQRMCNTTQGPLQS
ncbi:hypothetical protein DSO57_1026717 [Entomophthora muscae]|uniref:Uncharacterized protein n=1 Tax=Entomophthora muscae TaxID=34485 RepID=A0ACC2TCX9_9FUNG|nr:hypothetical protein DSO57_1026717 [Entomophthora muscae]